MLYMYVAVWKFYYKLIHNDLPLYYSAGDPVIATKIPAPMGSPWHSLIYFPLLDRSIYY